MEDGEFDRVPEVLGGLDLGDIYPQRRVFHFTEALNLWALLADWFYQRGEGEEALEMLDRMIELDPDHATTQYTELLLMPLIVRQTVMLYRGRSRKRGKSKSKPKSKSAARRRPGASAASGNRTSPDDIDPAPAPLPRNAC
jgi:hypothetical protein